MTRAVANPTANVRRANPTLPAVGTIRHGPKWRHAKAGPSTGRRSRPTPDGPSNNSPAPSSNPDREQRAPLPLEAPGVPGPRLSPAVGAAHWYRRAQARANLRPEVEPRPAAAGKEFVHLVAAAQAAAPGKRSACDRPAHTELGARRSLSKWPRRRRTRQPRPVEEDV